MKPIKYRMWDSWNEVMSYSDEDLATFFERYQLSYMGQNNPILMESIGLIDKNGDHIYEEDFLKHGDYIAKVRWYNYFSTSEGYTIVGWQLDSAEICPDPNEYEIIGNTYENPELLKQD